MSFENQYNFTYPTPIFSEFYQIRCVSNAEKKTEVLQYRKNHSDNLTTKQKLAYSQKMGRRKFICHYNNETPSIFKRMNVSDKKVYNPTLIIDLSSVDVSCFI